MKVLPDYRDPCADRAPYDPRGFPMLLEDNGRVVTSIGHREIGIEESSGGTVANGARRGSSPGKRCLRR